MKIREYVRVHASLQPLLEFPMHEFDIGSNGKPYKEMRKKAIRTDLNLIWLRMRPFIIATYIGLLVLVFWERSPVVLWIFAGVAIASLAFCIRPLIQYVKSRETFFMEKGILHRAFYLRPIHKKAVRRYYKILLQDRLYVLYLREFSLEFHQEKVKEEQLRQLLIMPDQTKEYLAGKAVYDREFEADIVKVCGRIPIIAIQNIKECIEGMNLTALNEDFIKLFASHKNWQDLTLYLMNYSRWVIVFISQGSEGIAWEIHLCRYLKRQNTTLIIHARDDYEQFAGSLADFPNQCSKGEAAACLGKLMYNKVVA